MLSDYYRIAERQYMKGDYGATDEIVDVGRAIVKADLTDRQQEALRLVYVYELTQAEAGQRMGIDRANVSQYITNAIRKIAENI